MKRIDTATVEADKHGTGRDGFTNGDPGLLIPPTQLDATFFDHMQEEVAVAVERDGQVLDDTTFRQLHRAVSRNETAIDSNFAVSGFDVVEVAAPSLNGQLEPGVFFSGGRRYNVSAADIDAAGTDSPRAYTASMITYITAKPNASDDTAFDFTAYEVALGTIPLPIVGAGEALISVVVTNGSEITSAQGWIESLLNIIFPQISLGPNSAIAQNVVSPRVNITGIGDQDGNTLGRETNDVAAGGRYWRRLYLQERYMRGLNGVGSQLGRGRQFMRHATVTSAGSNISIDLGYTTSQPPNEAGMSVSAHIIATRTDVATGQTKSWRMMRGFARDNVGALTFEGAEVRQEITAAGNADVSFNLTGSIPSLELSVAGAGETWEFTCQIETLISRF